VPGFSYLQPNPFLVFAQGDSLQTLSDAGTPHTEPVLQSKQGAMGGALQKVLGEIKKPVRLPLEIDPGVGTAVAIGQQLSPSLQQNHSHRTLWQGQGHPTGTWIFQREG
jgi:hypothetical protein